MSLSSNYQIRQPIDEFQPPESGKLSVIQQDDSKAKAVLFAIAAGDGLTKHTPPLPAVIQIIKGEATLTVGHKPAAGKLGTWVQMATRTPHSTKAESPLVMLLTLLKQGAQQKRKRPSSQECDEGPKLNNTKSQITQDHSGK